MNTSTPRLLPRLDGTVLMERDGFELETGEVVEVPLLLSGRQVSALEKAAYLRGQTTAEMMRQLLHDFIAHEPDLV